MTTVLTAASFRIEAVTDDTATVWADGRRVGKLQRYPLRRDSWWVQVGRRCCSDLTYHEAARLAGVLYHHPAALCRTDLEPASPDEPCRCTPRTEESLDA